MRCSNEGVALAHGVAQLRCYPKVRHFHLPRLCQQDVAALDVPVNLQAHMRLYILQYYRIWMDVLKGTLQMTLAEVKTVQRYIVSD